MKRLKCGEINWHVFARGVRRLELFRDAEDYVNFLSILEFALSASGCVLWAVAVMTNHFHLALRGSSEELTACMLRLNTMYSNYHNRKYGLVGHAFDGPYKAYPQSSLFFLLRTIAYIFLNPVAGGKSATPADYPWSSYRSFVGLPGSPIETNPTRLLAEVDPDPRVVWAMFNRAMERESLRAKQKPQIGLTMVEVHAHQFEWLLEEASERKDLPPGMDSRQLAIWWGHQCGIAPRAMARVLGDSQPKAISSTIRRIARRMVDQPEVRQRLQPPA